MIRTIDDDAGAFLRRIARDVFSLSFCLSLSLSLSVFRIPNNTQRRERDDILERQNFVRKKGKKKTTTYGESSLSKNISHPFFVYCTVQGFAFVHKGFTKNKK